ncbi:MAG: CPBP family intramembrane glutamic endopeptidase [Chitinophagaceae bacterium]
MEIPLQQKGWLRATLFTITFLILNILLAFATRSLHLRPVAEPSNILQVDARLITLLGATFIAFALVYLFRKLADRKSFLSLGLVWENNESFAATGLFLAPVILGTGCFVLIANGNLHWSEISFDAKQLFLSFGLLLLIALAEELVFRGYILNNLLQSLNKWLALSASALVFALFHANNPEINIIAFLNIFLAGLLIGINYIYTRNLWFGILFHVGWNFYQGPVLGFKVSGATLAAVLEQELTGNALITGGNFGFEGSIVNTILLLISLAILVWVYEKKFQLL